MLEKFGSGKSEVLPLTLGLYHPLLGRFTVLIALQRAKQANVVLVNEFLVQSELFNFLFILVKLFSHLAHIFDLIHCFLDYFGERVYRLVLKKNMLHYFCNIL